MRRAQDRPSQANRVDEKESKAEEYSGDTSCLLHGKVSSRLGPEILFAPLGASHVDTWDHKGAWLTVASRSFRPSRLLPRTAPTLNRRRGLASDLDLEEATGWTDELHRASFREVRNHHPLAGHPHHLALGLQPWVQPTAYSQQPTAWRATAVA